MSDIIAIRSSFFDFVSPVSTPDELENSARFIDDGLLILQEGKIVSLEPWDLSSPRLDACRQIIHLPNKVVMPGFIDSHIHYPQTEMIGADGEQLLDWLNQYTFPTESRYQCPERCAAMAEFFLEQLLRNGTTTAMVYGTVHAESVEALFSSALKRNMRIIAGKVMMDRHAPDALLESVGHSQDTTRELITRWHNKGRLSYALTPRFAPTSTPELLAAAGQLRREFPDVYLQTHLSENLQEIAWVKTLFPERAHYFDVYHHHGLTGHKCVFAHCLHLEDDEWRALAHSGSSIAFCPTSNLFLGSGLFSLQKKWHWHIPLGIGTDVGAGTTFNLLQTLAEAYKISQLRGYRLSAFEALYHATLGGAWALALDGELGNFMPGKAADFVVLDPQATPLQQLRQANSATLRQRLFLLMILGDDRSIYQTWVQGDPVWSRDKPAPEREVA